MAAGKGAAGGDPFAVGSGRIAGSGNRKGKGNVPMSETLEKRMDLTLYQIEAGLLELVEYRQMRLEDKEDPPTAEELEVLEGEIRRYEIASPAKVAGVIGILRKWRTDREAAETEVKRLRAIVHSFEAMESRLKDAVAEVLRLLPMPEKGARKLHGSRGGYLMLKGNGGVP